MFDLSVCHKIGAKVNKKNIYANILAEKHFFCAFSYFLFINCTFLAENS